MKKVSVVIPTYNLKDALVDAVESLFDQTYSIEEIIVVDNASTDGTADTIKKLQKTKKAYKTVKLIENKKNLGVTGGRNTGLKAAKGDYILFFDHDMVARPTMVEELVQVAELKKEIGIVTPKIYFWDKKKIIWAAGTDINLWTGQVIFYGGLDKGQFNEEKEVAIAPAVLFVKKEVAKKIGGFDDTYFAVYEDTDYCFRAKEAGYLTYYTPNAVAYHKIPYDDDIASIRLLGRAYWVARNRIIFMKRFGKAFPVFLLFSPLYFAYYVRLALKYKMPSAAYSYSRGIFAGLSH